MKKTIIAALLAIFSSAIYAQTVITPIWMKTEIGAVGNNAEAWGVDVDENENEIDLLLEEHGVFHITIDNGTYRIRKKIVNLKN